jgi:gliding motility-associated-like protein
MYKKIVGIGLLVVSFLINANAQGFDELTSTLLPASGNSVICAGDLNNDGLMDLVIGGQDSFNSFAKAFQNNGDSTFLDMGIGLPTLTSYAINLNDLNSDGWIDILMSGVNASNVPEFYIFINQQNGTFTSITHNIPGLRYGHIETKDLNLDGLVDIFVLGLTSNGNYTAIFKNDGNLSFSLINYDFPDVYNGGAVLADLNNDGNTDIFYTGINTSFFEESFIYINNGNWAFTNRTSDIPGISNGKVQSSDINNDGFVDIAVFGNDKNDNYITKIYKNNLGSSFVLHSDLQGIIDGSIKFGDYNADGYSDLLVTGKNQSEVYTTILYDNISGVSFSENAIALTGLSNSACQWIDLNNDNKLDFIISGYQLTGPALEFYMNNEPDENQNPESPANLVAVADSNRVVLSWHNAFDNEQVGKSLSYDFWLKNETINELLFSPTSDLLNGFRKLPKQGSIEDTIVRLNDLPEGKYIWSVQSVDAAFSGSQFAIPDTFFIAYPASIGNDTNSCFNQTINLSVAEYEGSAKWYSVKNPTNPLSIDKQFNYTVIESDTIFVNLTKSFGVVVSDTIIIYMDSLPVVELGNNLVICPGSIVDLEIENTTYISNWSTLSENYSAINTPTFTNSFVAADKIYVEVINENGCVNYDSVQVDMHEIPSINLVNDTAVCKFSTIHLSLTVNTDSINWYTMANELLLANSQSIDLLIDSNQELIVESFNDFGCSNRDTIQIDTLSLPIADAGVDKLICQGYSTSIGPETINDNYNYLWSPEVSINSITSVNPLVNPASDTKYYLVITDQNECTATDSVSVKINPTGIFDIGVDTSICPGDEVVLGGNPTAVGSIMPYSYEWSPTASLNGFTTANPTASPNETTEYTLVIYTGDCPVDTLKTTVTVNPIPIITIMNDTLVGYKEDITLWVSGGAGYSWTPAEYLDNPLLPNPVANLEITTHFISQVTNEFGCKDTAGVTIYIKNEIFIPELFTPNDDGNNDFFKVYGFGIKQLSLTIFDDNGLNVFESSDLMEITNIGWNGNSKGNMVKEGKYFWKMTGEYYDGTKVLFKGRDTGIITILR